jgi:hypothetical protein
MRAYYIFLRQQRDGLTLSHHISWLKSGAHSVDSQKWVETGELMRCGRGISMRAQWRELRERDCELG